MINLNKVFPRLTISAKLAIAFVAVAVIPLAVVGLLGTRSAMSELTRAAEADLGHDLELAFSQASGAVVEIERHVSFLAAAGLAGVATGEERPDVADIARTYLVTDSSALFRVKVLDADGFRVLAVRRPRLSVAPEEMGEEPLYHWTAQGLAPGVTALLPVEFRAADAGGTNRVVPAIAAILPLYEGDTYVGAVVGEADAADLFASLDIASPGLQGVTGLVDMDGFFLYHTELKQNWSQLLANRGDLDLASQLGVDMERELLAGGDEGLVRDEGGAVVAWRRIRTGADGSRDLVLYRAVPLRNLRASVRRFLTNFSALGFLLTLGVLGVSVLAAGQITRPIYRLRTAVRSVAEGEAPGELRVETNDEIEDLAMDFSQMAQVLDQHRRGLETLVEERTRQMMRAEEELRQIVTLSADAIIGLDPAQRVHLWNRGASEIFGYSASEALGVRLEELIGPEKGEHPAEKAYFERALESIGSVSNYRTTRHAKDGEPIPVTVTTTALRDEGGHLAGYSVIVRDDRAREQLEEQMRRSERLSAISVMAAGLAHELNNPLSVLGNRIELMQRDAMARDDDQRLLRDLDVLGKHVKRIGAVTGDLLRFAREDSDLMESVQVNHVVERVGRLLQRVFVAEDVQLEMELAEGLPPLLANESAVETVLVNLLLNAQQATPAGGRVEIVTRVAEGDSEVEVEVRDTGPGVPEELRLRIFEPFFTTKADRGGTGLGLAVCRALVDRCGGRISVANRDNGACGARFTMSFPQDATGHA